MVVAHGVQHRYIPPPIISWTPLSRSLPSSQDGPEPQTPLPSRDVPNTSKSSFLHIETTSSLPPLAFASSLTSTMPRQERDCNTAMKDSVHVSRKMREFTTHHLHPSVSIKPFPTSQWTNPEKGESVAFLSNWVEMNQYVNQSDRCAAGPEK